MYIRTHMHMHARTNAHSARAQIAIRKNGGRHVLAKNSTNISNHAALQRVCSRLSLSSPNRFMSSPRVYTGSLRLLRQKNSLRSRKKGRSLPRCRLRRCDEATCNGHQAAQPSFVVVAHRELHEAPPEITLLPPLPLAQLRNRRRRRHQPLHESWLQSLAPSQGCL